MIQSVPAKFAVMYEEVYTEIEETIILYSQWWREKKNDRSGSAISALHIMWIFRYFSEAKSREITSYLNFKVERTIG